MDHTIPDDRVNPRSLFFLFQELYDAEFPSVAPSWNAKDASLLKKLIAEQGQGRTRDYVAWAIANYTRLRQQFRLTGYPTVGMLWGFRSSFLAMMDEPRKNSVIYDAKRNGTGVTAGTTSGKLFMSR